MTLQTVGTSADPAGPDTRRQGGRRPDGLSPDRLRRRLPGRRRPPAVPGTVIALDIGAVRTRGELISGNGRLLEAEEWATRPDCGPAVVVETLLDGAARLTARAGRRPAAAGLVVPGVIDEVSGRADFAANLGLRGVPLRQWLAEHLDLPVAFGHDVRAGGIAESRLGAGKGCRGFAFVSVGVGVAAAFVVNGALLPGLEGHSPGELGHLVVDPGGEPCACGNRGCLERVASASAVTRRYGRATGERGLSVAEVYARAEAGDPEAARITRQATSALAEGLAATTALLGLERIVIGGDMAAVGEPVLRRLRDELVRRLPFRPPPHIVPARLGDRAGCLGAALLARDMLRRPGTRAAAP